MNVDKAMETIKNSQSQMRGLALGIVDTDPWVEIKLQGKHFKYELSFGAVEDILRATGITVGVDRITTDLIVSRLKEFLWAGLRTHHEDVFPARFEDAAPMVAAMLTFKHLNYYVTVIENALTATQPDPEQMAAILGDLREATASLEDRRPLEEERTSDGSGDAAESLALVETILGE